MKRILTNTLALLVVIAVLATVNPVSAADLTADRTISGTVCPGSTFTVTVDLTVTGSPVNGLSITEDLSALPSDWTVSPNNGGIYSPTTKKVEYVWFDASGNLGSQSVTYDVTVPGTATIGASCDITGDAGITPPGSTVAIGTDTVTVVSCDDPPTVTLIYPTDGEDLSGDVTLNASATADPDGSIVSVVFYHSDDDGSTWTEIGTGAASGIYYTCAWDTKTVDNGDYKVKAVAEDDLAGTGAGEDESDVSIDNGFCLQLEAGLNFVSIPKTLDGSNVAETVFNIDSYAGEFCLYYNAAAGSYDTTPLVKPCRGYWVYKNAAMPICVSFDDAAMGPSQQLYKGWNMIGHIDTEELPIYEAGNTADFGSVTGLEEPEENKLFRQVNTYTQDLGWINYPIGDLTEMTSGAGYWILMKEDVEMYGMP